MTELTSNEKECFKYSGVIALYSSCRISSINGNNVSGAGDILEKGNKVGEERKKKIKKK